MSPVEKAFFGALGIVMFALSGCVAFPEPLYGGATVNITEDSAVSRPRPLKREMERTIRPLPNTIWFGAVRPGLGMYYLLDGEPEEEGLRAWLFDRFAEEPVYLATITPDRTADALETWLFDRGYFDAEITWERRDAIRAVRVEYDARIEEPYRFARPGLPALAGTDPGTEDTDSGTEALWQSIRSTLEETLVTPGERYSLEILRRERTRIDRALKNEGYFAFSPDYLFFDAHRDDEHRTVEVELRVRDDIPAEAVVPYRIGSITVHADHQPGEERDRASETEVPIDDDYHYIERFSRYRPELIAAAILFQPGDTYRREEHVQTINRLMSLGVFRFVNIRYRQDRASGVLHVDVLLTPAPEKTVEGELRAITRSDGFAGPGVSARYRDRNTFSGAEAFSIDLNAGFETLIGTNLLRFDSWELGVDTSLSIPRAFTPFGGEFERRGPVMPRTTLRGSVNTVTRIDKYRLEQISSSLGYEWTTGSALEHDLRPFDITYVRHREYSGEFRDLLDTNPALQSGFEEQVIIGGSYRLLYADRRERGGLLDREEPRAPHLFLYGRLDLAGNTASLVQSALNDRAPDPDNPFTVGGVLYSQFVRLETDLRYSVPLGREARLAGRFFAGAGHPLGNSAVLPRVKQFSLGGPNSIRAFQPRTVGPGTLRPASAGGPEMERTGDLRLELNLEYRFGIAGILKGAVFADAGNIWSLDPEADQDTGAPAPDRILDETAMGAGIGFRVDPEFVVVRLDVATPLRKPWLPRNQRWVIDRIDLADRDWRRENVVFNLSIGYPF